MTQYINTETLEYPIFEAKIKKEFYNTSFENNFQPPYPYSEVLESPIPQTVGYQTMEEVEPKFLNGVWYRDYVVKDLSAEIIAAANLRKGSLVRDQRNRLLNQSDWTQVADAPVDKQAWAVYRQALRDITNQPGFPTEVTWPTKPE